jgi:phage gp37-like protein
VLDRTFLSCYMDNYVGIVNTWVPEPSSSRWEVIAIGDFLNRRRSKMVPARPRRDLNRWKLSTRYCVLHLESHW